MKTAVPVSIRSLFCSIALLMLVNAPAFASVSDQTQQVRSVAGFSSDRGANERRDPTTLKPFNVTAKLLSQNAVSSGKVTETRTHDCCAYSIYSARTELFDDFDYDGFFTYLRVSFDIDTVYDEAQLYAEVYMQGATGDWTLIFDSNVFTIYGNSGLDAYEVETELLAGYPTDYYDVLVEVYDAYTGELVLEYGPEDHAALSLLPMEEVQYDARTLPPIVNSSGGGGGALSGWSMLLLLLVLQRRQLRFYKRAA